MSLKGPAPDQIAAGSMLHRSGHMRLNAPLIRYRSRSCGGRRAVSGRRRVMGDGDGGTKAAATVSLFLIGDSAGQAQILRWMEQCASVVGSLLHELHRVADVKRLAFLKPALQRCETSRWLVGESYAVDRILERNQR